MLKLFRQSVPIKTQKFLFEFMVIETVMIRLDDIYIIKHFPQKKTKNTVSQGFLAFIVFVAGLKKKAKSEHKKGLFSI